VTKPKHSIMPSAIFYLLLSTKADQSGI
jgi:hypothetical protein